MVVHQACACYHLVGVGVVASVVAIYSQSLCCGNILSGIEHVEVFVHLLKADIALIRDLEAAPRAFLCLYLNHTRCTARAVHGCLGRILQYAKTLDVGRVYCGKRKHVRSHAIDKYQRVVASDDGGGATDTHAVEHGHSVQTVRCYVDTSRLTAQHVKGIVGCALASMISQHLYYIVPVANGILLLYRDLLLRMN